MGLYNLVNSIVTSQSEEDAKELLMGSNILLLNNKEYYNAIISNFIQKKETIIKKENGKIVFDLNNTTDIWNIIFISEYIKENDILYKTYNNLLLEIVNIEGQLLVIKNKHKTAKSKEEHAAINTEYQNLNNVLSAKKNQRDSMSGVIETFYRTDWIELVNTNSKIEQMQEINVLKQAINIIHKVRNSLEHDNIDIDKIIELDNDNFKISIPIEYLDGFNKGKIIANDEDRVIVERTNLIALPLLSELNCNIDSLQSIFYNIEPDFLSLLLEKYNYNIKDIYKLSRGILKNSQKTKELLNKGIDIELIEKIPYMVADSFTSTQEIIDMINYLTKENMLDKIGKITPYAFKNADILDIYLKNGIDLDIINSFEWGAFVNPLYAISLLEKVNILKENGINFSKLIKRFSNKRDVNRIPFDYAKEIIRFTNRLKENNIPIEVLYDENLLKEELFENSENFKKMYMEDDVFIPLIRPVFWFAISTDGKSFDPNNWIVDELTKNGIKHNEIGIYGQNFEKLKTVLINNNLYPMSEDNNNTYIALELLRVMEYLDKEGTFYENVSIFDNISYLVKNGVNIEIIDSMSIDAIVNAKQTLFFIQQGIRYDEIAKIPASGYRYPKETITFIKFLKENDLSLEIVNDDLFLYPLNSINLLKSIPKDKMHIVRSLSELSISNIDETIEIINTLTEYNINFDNISMNFIDGAESSISLIKWLEEKKYNIRVLEKLPACAFFRFNEMDQLQNILKYFEQSWKKYENLPDNGKSYLEQTEEVIEVLFNNGYTVDKEIPTKIFSVPNVKDQNIEYLLKLVNYEYKKLDEFPDEFYTCNYEILEHMCKNYNYNLCKSIFGLDNPKLIATLIYGNSVFSQYQKQNQDDLLIDIDPITIIHAGFNTSMMYKNSINVSDWNQETYLARFINDENQQPRDNIEMKRYILDKFRNAFAHFRFKPVIDNNGEIVTDKIHIYDKYDESNDTNFDIILDIKDFVEITRQVEKGLLQKKDEMFDINEENRFKKR